MPIKTEEYNQVCVMAVGGDLVGETSASARKVVEEHIDQKQMVDFILDFENTHFIDSEGLETLLWIERRCEDLFGKMKLINLDENCQKILEITRLTPRFECHPSLESALKTMR